MTSLKSLARIRSPKVSLAPGQHSLLVGDLLLELGAKENVVMTWDLKRYLAEFKRSVQPTVLVGSGKGKIGRVCISFFVYIFRIMD